jgi:hypothetical protein
MDNLRANALGHPVGLQLGRRGQGQLPMTRLNGGSVGDMSQVKAPTDEMPVCQGRTTLSELSCVPQRNRHRWISLHQCRINMAAADRILLVVIHIPDHHQHSAILRVLPVYISSPLKSRTWLGHHGRYLQVTCSILLLVYAEPESIPTWMHCQTQNFIAGGTCRYAALLAHQTLETIVVTVDIQKHLPHQLLARTSTVSLST